jgi:HEAT repeat protein
MLTHILDDGWCYDLHLEDEDLSEYDITFPSFSHSDETRLQAAIALGQIGGSDALESLMRTLESWHLSTRERGMKGLLETNDMQAIPMIKELLEQTPYPDIRSSMEKTLRDLERKFEIL